MTFASEIRIDLILERR